MSYAVERTDFDNGLTLLSRQVPHAPSVSVYLAYQVGGRTEPVGCGGVSHLVEHMLFRGSPRFPSGDVALRISTLGGEWNGATWHDYTAYFETLPATALDVALDIEADRMLNACFDSQTLDSERHVVAAERRGEQSSPRFWLAEATLAAAYAPSCHPYGVPLLGTPESLAHVSPVCVYEYYRAWYRPDNAVLVVVGDFEPDAIVERVDYWFGHLRRRKVPPVPRRLVLPELTSAQSQRVVVSRPAAPPVLTVSFRLPAAANPDNLPACIAAGVLAGGRSARLVRSLVGTGLASSVNAQPLIARDPHLVTISATPRASVDHERVEQVVLAEVDRLARCGPDAAELARIKRQLAAGYLFSTETTSNQARMIGQYAMIDSAARFETYLDDLARVSADDVQTAAQRWFVERDHISGWLQTAASDDTSPSAEAEEQTWQFEFPHH